MISIVAISGFVPPTCKVDVEKIQHLTLAEILGLQVCNFEGASIRIEGNQVIVEAN